LLRQTERIEAFRRAIARVVRPGDRVLEIGAGLGTYAYFAAEAGAARVWAVDGHPVIHVAQTVARLNDYADHVTFVRGWLPEAGLAEPADVVIFEDFPPRLADARVWRLLRDVRRAGLAPGVRFVPAAARIFVAPVASAALMAELTLDAETPRYGVDWSAARAYVANCPHRVSIPREALLHEGTSLASLRLDQPWGAAALGGEVTVTVPRAGLVHGLAYWFNLELCEGEGLSNRPGDKPGSWGQLLLPLDPPLEVAQGEALRIRVSPETLSDGAPGWLGWDVRTGAAQRRGHEFGGTPLGLKDLHEASRDAIPRLTDVGRLAGEALGLVNGRRTVKEIAECVAQSRRDLALAEVEELVIRQLRGRITTLGVARSGGEL